MSQELKQQTVTQTQFISTQGQKPLLGDIDSRPLAVLNDAPLGQSPVIGGIGEVSRLKTYSEQSVHITMDDSGSMAGTKAKEATCAVKALLKELASPKNKDGFRVNVIRFGSSAHIEATSAAPESVSVTFSGTSGGTTAAPALKLARNAEQSFVPREERKRVGGIVVFMSDGQLGDTAEATRMADEIKQMGMTIISIGFGSDVDQAALQRIATSPQHYAHSDIGQLSGLFASVGRTISQQLGAQ